MRIVLHNPNNVKGARSNELSLAYESMDAVLMPGTQTRLKKHAKQAVLYTNDQHHIYEWGWKPTPYVNKSCGVQIRLTKISISNEACSCNSPNAALGSGKSRSSAPQKRQI
jgi:hypothetical protein